MLKSKKPIIKPNLKKKEDIKRSYDRPNFYLEVSGKGKEILVTEKILSTLKNAKFTPLCLSTSLFNFKNKKVFIKETFYKIDYYQLKDYLKQKQIVSNLVDVYGVLKFKNGRVYVFSKKITNGDNLYQYLKKNKSQDYSKIREQIKVTGEKLIAKALLPWDFQIKQFILDAKSKKVYLCDNAVNFYNPSHLISYFRKLKLKVPASLQKLNLIYSLNPFEISASGVKFILKKIKPKEKVNERSFLDGKDTNFRKIQTTGKYIVNKTAENIISKTIEFYEKLPFETKQKIQKEILKEALLEYDLLIKK